MLRYKLRTLLVLLAILPPLLALGWWRYSAWRAEQARLKALAAERQKAMQQAMASPFRMLLNVRNNASGLWQPPVSRQPQGERDYQFPPQRHLRLSEEEVEALQGNPFAP